MIGRCNALLCGATISATRIRFLDGVPSSVTFLYQQGPPLFARLDMDRDQPLTAVIDCDNAISWLQDAKDCFGGATVDDRRHTADVGTGKAPDLLGRGP